VKTIEDMQHALKEYHVNGEFVKNLFLKGKKNGEL